MQSVYNYRAINNEGLRVTDYCRISSIDRASKINRTPDFGLQNYKLVNMKFVYSRYNLFMIIQLQVMGIRALQHPNIMGL